MMGNFNDAARATGRTIDITQEEDRRRREFELICPKCQECNRPGVINVDLGENGVAVCRSCSHDWRPGWPMPDAKVSDLPPLKEQ